MRLAKVAVAIGAMALLCLCACTGARTESFEGITIEIPGNWVATDPGATETVSSSRMWHADNGNERHGIVDGGIIMYKVPYDGLSNLDVGLSDYTYDEKVRKAEEFAQATIKSADARLMASKSIEGFSNPAPEADFKLEDREGHAVWAYEGPGKNGTDIVLGIPFDDYLLIALGICPSNEDAGMYRASLDSIAFTEACDTRILEVSSEIEGGTASDAFRHVADSVGKLEVYASSSTSGGSTKSTTPASPTPSPNPAPSYKSSSSSSDDFELVDRFETANGTGYQGNDGNYYFKNDDGTVEATDGWGNGVRDEDGDGEADKWTDDGGQTWHSF